MAEKLWAAASFGRRYLTSAMIYAGLALVVVGLTPDVTELRAEGGSCDAYSNPCSSGEQCCQGECIPDDHNCCDDGTSGPNETEDGRQCGCCTGCESQCSEPSTYMCEEEE